MKKKEIRVRCWIDVNGVRFFGPGRAELLQLIDETGSIAKAAKAMGMSYKKAWAMVDEMNASGRKPYVKARKGGEKGGGTEITVTGRKVLNAYQKLVTKLEMMVEKEKQLIKLI